VRARADLHQEQFELTSLDGPVAVSFQVPWLGGNGHAPEPAPEPPAPSAEEPPAELAPPAQPVDAPSESPILPRFAEET
jgi:hypothetical protein